MDKKRLLIFGGLSILAIVCAFGIVNIFSANVYSNKKKNKQVSQDFIDIYSINKTLDEEGRFESEVELDNDDNKISNEKDEKKENDIPVSTQHFEKLETESWDEYIANSEEYGFAMSDVSNTIINNYETVLSDETKISEGELSFLNNLKILADNYTAAYEEALSYIFGNDMEGLEAYFNGDYKKTIDEFASLDTLGVPEFEMIKEEYLNGMLSSQKGFEAYMNKPGSPDGNDFFFESDEYFYNGQLKLTQLLDSYK